MRFAPSAATLSLSFVLAACAASQTPPAEEPASGAAGAPLSTTAPAAPDQTTMGEGMQGEGMMGQGMMKPDQCPMAVPGTTVEVDDVAAGVAMVFRSTSDPKELLKRVESMAQMHERRRSSGGGMGMQGMMGGGQGPGPHGKMAKEKGQAGGMRMKPGQGGMKPAQGGMMMGRGAMMQAEARAEAIDGGARLVFSLEGDDAIANLRKQARMHAQGMAGGGCPMMAMHGQPAP